ncbi:hypothetical protein V6N12_076114 [Hibiscus sabdariffa]|uniref:Uncharacterized protein n=1 Tax=Hibiscus sabdariffa TaxID=183260 RepID=A0ABR2AYF5_9ROSI
MGYFLPSSSIPVLCLFTLPKAFEKGLILFTDSFPSCPRFEGYETDSQRGSVESHKKRLFLLRAPLPVGFGKLFCSNSDKVLKVADDLLFTAKESRARSAAVSSYDLKHLTFVVRTYSPSAGNTQFA